MKKIIYWVIAIHLGLVVLCSIDHWIHRRPLPRSIAIRTVKARPPSPPPFVAAMPKLASSKPTSKTKTQDPPPPKKPISKAPKPPPPAPYSEPQAPRTQIALPSLIPEKPIAAPPAHVDPDSSYEETLISFLRSCLQLPEYGEVRAELTLTREGRLLRVHILEAKSPKNGEFLKKKLPELLYPCFNDSSPEVQLFTVVFQNEDTFSSILAPSPSLW